MVFSWPMWTGTTQCNSTHKDNNTTTGRLPLFLPRHSRHPIHMTRPFSGFVDKTTTTMALATIRQQGRMHRKFSASLFLLMGRGLFCFCFFSTGDGAIIITHTETQQTSSAVVTCELVVHQFLRLSSLEIPQYYKSVLVSPGDPK